MNMKWSKRDEKRAAKMGFMLVRMVPKKEFLVSETFVIKACRQPDGRWPHRTDADAARWLIAAVVNYHDERQIVHETEAQIDTCRKALMLCATSQ